MSETSETKGRCRQQLEAWFANNISSVPRYSWMIADAIDRLAADVAAVMEMTQEIALRVPSEFGEDACDAAVRVALKERDAAVRERDEARAEAQRIQDEADDQEQTDKVKRLNAEIDKIHYTLMNRTWERDEARAEVERLKAELAADVAAVKEAVCDGSVAEERDRFLAKMAAAIRERDEARGKVERLRAELAARPAANSSEIPDSSPADPPPAAPAAGWLTDEERHILGAHLQSLRDQRRAMDRGGQTLGYSADPCGLKREADVIDNLLARAGSPPVVEVPPFENYAPEVLHLRYRDAISRAGVKWKEVPRE